MDWVGVLRADAAAEDDWPDNYIDHTDVDQLGDFPDTRAAGYSDWEADILV